MAPFPCSDTLRPCRLSTVTIARVLTAVAPSRTKHQIHAEISTTLKKLAVFVCVFYALLYMSCMVIPRTGSGGG